MGTGAYPGHLSRAAMFDLERAIAAWRQFHASRRAFLAEDLEELERHLRDHVAQLQKSGLDEEVAFRQAMQLLGDVEGGEAEYRKVYWGKLRRRYRPTHELRWRLAMLANYLKIAIRNLAKYKGYSFINISGLTIGITCCLLIVLWVHDEVSYDRFHDHASTLYRVVENQNYADGVFPVAVTPAPLAPALKQDFPEIVDATRLSFTGRLVSYQDASFYETDIAVVDPSFLTMFSFPVLTGDATTLLDDPFSVVISPEIARKYFGEGDPVGKILRFNDEHDLTVTGVIENVPHNSHLQFTMLMPISFYESLGQNMENWRSNWLYTYVQVQDGVRAEDVDAKIVDVIKQNNEGSVTDLYLQPVSRIHLHSDFTADIGGHGDVQYVYIFSVIALFVLLIACINFMNLSTARSANRAKEVGMRKVFGARRTHLIRQFYGESLLIACIALLMGLVLIVLLLPAFNDLSQKQLSLGIVTHGPILAGLIGITLFTGIFAGSYPALFLSSFRPVKVLKGTIRTGTRSALFRSVLVVTQFALSIVLIIGTGVIYTQLDYIRNKKLGFDKEHLIYIVMRGNIGQSYDALKSELTQNPNILGVTAASGLPTYIGSSTSGFDWEGKNPDDDILMHYNEVDFDYFETLKMEMAEGRSFSRAFPSDTVSAVIVNEEAVRVMGVESPLETRFEAGGEEVNIVGVVKDFHFKPIDTKIEPIVIALDPDDTNFMFIRVHPTGLSATLAYLEETWKTVIPDYPFEYNFLDEAYDRIYRAEENLGSLVNYFSVLAIFIACLGLFGLASFTAEQRSREIGIRKVLGASVPGLTVSMCREFIKLVVIANVLAWPIAYYALQNWLEGFAYRTDIDWGLFVLTGVLALVIATFTVSYQAVKAARANPVEVLRYE